MSKQATRLGLSAIGVGGILMYAALVLWVGGVASMATADGNPPGLLNGYGPVALLGVSGLALIVFGIDRVARAFVSHEPSVLARPAETAHTH